MKKKPLLSKKDVVYISGPMQGYPDFNYPLFHEVERELKKRFSCKVLNPARNLGGRQNLPRHVYMRIDYGHIIKATAICLLPGWELSHGAWNEWQVAKDLRLKQVLCVCRPRCGGFND